MNAAALLWSARATVFDLDGTLVDTLPDLAVSLDAALVESGLPAVGPAVVRLSLHGGLEASVQAALQVLGVAPTRYDEVLTRYHRLYDAAPARHSRVYRGVSQLLARLQDRGHRIAVCTNKSERLARELLDRVGLARFMRTVVGADTCGRRKPDPAPLRLVLSRLEAAACEAVLVGDSAVDRDCAGAAGVCCLIFEGGYGEAQAQGPLRFADYESLLLAEPALAPHWQRERETPASIPWPASGLRR